MRRPIGIWIISFLAIAAGVMYLAGGLNLMGAVMFGPARSGTGVWFTGFLSAGIGIAFIAIGAALFTLKPLALAFVMLLGVLGLLGAGWALLLTGDLAYGLSQAILPAFLLWYANRPEIQETFGF
ncbi:MAG TPA: hypothetical protein VFQ75_11575 [Candidatus Limnocylindrales bacterium]|jgi:hypothetical protein|nr:hypothetical protein [Candidatus Limnocylindrales bacterium]